MLRPEDWRDMATYFLPTTTMVGAYLEIGGGAWGAVAVAVITCIIVALLHLWSHRNDLP